MSFLNILNIEENDQLEAGNYQSSISKTILPSTLRNTERSLSASKQQRTYQYHETINRVTDNRCALGFVAYTAQATRFEGSKLGQITVSTLSHSNFDVLDHPIISN